MRTLWNGLRARASLRAVRASLAAAALGAVLMLGSNVAVGDGGMSGGGGDQIGSLPCNLIPPENLTAKPSFIMLGTREDLLASVVDAYGTGSASLVQNLETGKWQLGFHGHVHAFLNRNMIESGCIDAGIAPGTVYAGGVAVLKLNGTAQGRVLLPRYGLLDVPLANLTLSGVLNHASLTVNSTSLNHQQNVIAMSASAHLVRIELRD